MTSHTDEARRIVERHPLILSERSETEVAEIAAALAAAERRGIERAAAIARERSAVNSQAKDATHTDADYYRREGAQDESDLIAAAIRALLPAEPAAKCATCGGSGSIQGPCPDKVSGKGMYAAPGISCAVYHAIPCPSCGGSR